MRKWKVGKKMERMKHEKLRWKIRIERNKVKNVEEKGRERKEERNTNRRYEKVGN